MSVFPWDKQPESEDPTDTIPDCNDLREALTDATESLPGPASVSDLETCAKLLFECLGKLQEVAQLTMTSLQRYQYATRLATARRAQSRSTDYCDSSDGPGPCSISHGVQRGSMERGPKPAAPIPAHEPCNAKTQPAEQSPPPGSESSDLERSAGRLRADRERADGERRYLLTANLAACQYSEPE